MRISESFIQQLKSSCDISDVISSYVPIKKMGRNQKCLCPFHLEKTPSLVIYEETQSFYCFGCGVGGDVITFISRIENLDYVEAIQFLAQRVGMSVPDAGEDDRKAKERARVFQMNRLAARFFFDQLVRSPGNAGLNYFSKRRLTRSTIIRYGLGYAPDEWDLLRDYLKRKGFSYEEMVRADLVAQSAKGAFYDKFRNRVIFPIIDLRGNVIAFGGRVLDDRRPKYLNSSDTAVFKKSLNLFSLNFAKNSGQRTLILGEGYMDVIAMNQAGFTNAVATLGTALTSQQAQLISRYADDVVIAYDSDQAGKKATERAAHLFSQTGISVRVLEISGAKDPDEYISKYGAGRFEVLLEKAAGITATQLSALRSKYQLDDPEQKAKYIGEYCAMIAQMPDQLKRDVYIGNLAKEAGIPREGILKRVEDLRGRKKNSWQKKQWNEMMRPTSQNRDKINPEGIKYPRANKAEEGILCFLFQNPNFWEYAVKRISAEEFVTSWNAKLYRVLTERLAQDQSVEISSFHEMFPPDEISRIARLMNSAQDFVNTKETLDDYISVVCQEHRKAKENVEEMTPEQLEQKRKMQAKQKH